jgi:hypothetical protein
MRELDHIAVRVGYTTVVANNRAAIGRLPELGDPIGLRPDILTSPVSVLSGFGA